MPSAPSPSNGYSAGGPPPAGGPLPSMAPASASTAAGNVGGGGASGQAHPNLASIRGASSVGRLLSDTGSAAGGRMTLDGSGVGYRGGVKPELNSVGGSAMNGVSGPGTLVNGTHAAEDDYVVYQGQGANGASSNMAVTLHNSFVHDSVVCCVRYSFDGQYLATGSNRCAHIFEAASGQRVAAFDREDGVGGGGGGGGGDDDGTGGSGADSYVRAVCFTPDGESLVTGAEDHVVKVWDVRNRTVRHSFVGHETDIYSVDASTDGRFIASGSGDKTAKLWSLQTGLLLTTLGGPTGATDGITSVAVSPTSAHVAAGSLDNTVRVWDVSTGQLVRSFDGHRDSVYSVAFSPDGCLLLSGSLDKTLKLWDLSAADQNSQQCRLTFTGHRDFVLSVAFSPDGRWLLSGSKDRTVQLWDPRNPAMALMLQGHKNSVISIAHNPVAAAIATGSGDCRARMWNYT
ncbi:hypothetical protein BU14_0120s0018 [Porphyra umbilicalis]|uniref:Uncharacterized protein n=1 Tax=Porphyra umbilicalis TaxID=2786 RepID=A0A1X6PBN5_PORUM|nr:hypothetical protein BU14_0120s0018 [Porphyra umbilicalis]|eukprot:OSX78135.1 hypothetical protein BU14_0120s0018 [Porphyra umbilicalis]